MGYYWPNMSKDDAVVQEKCQNCPLSMNKEESYVVFIAEDWRAHSLSTWPKEPYKLYRKLAY